MKFFEGVAHLILIEAQSPCAFFAYPGQVIRTPLQHSYTNHRMFCMGSV